MFSTDFIFRQQENLVDNQKCQATMQQNTISYQGRVARLPFPISLTVEFSNKTTNI